MRKPDKLLRNVAPRIFLLLTVTVFAVMYGLYIWMMDFNAKHLLFKAIQSSAVVLLLLAFLLAVRFQTKNKLLFLEIAERKKAEAELKKSLDRNKAMLGANPDIMFIFDSECRIIDFHAESNDQLFLPPELFMGKIIDDLFPPEIGEMTHLKVRSVLSTGLSEYSTYELQVEDKLEYFECRYELCGSDQVLAIVRNISKEKKAEEALRTSEERLRLAMSAARQGFYDLNVQTGDTVVNDEYATMLGYDPKTFVETNSFWIDRLHPDDLAITTKAYADYIAGKTAEYRVEFRQKTKDNEWKWISSVGKIVEYDRDEKPLRMLGTHVDITEQKLAEADINQKNEELIRMNATKDKFFSIIAHDLRSPFNGFLGLTQVMVEELPSLTLAQIQDIAVNLSKSATNIYRLLENLLQWSQIQRGTIPFESKKIQLHSAAKESIVLIQEIANNKGIEIISTISENIDVFADNNILQTILRNLVSNGVKYTEKGGKVLLSAQAVSDGK